MSIVTAALLTRSERLRIQTNVCSYLWKFCCFKTIIRWSYLIEPVGILPERIVSSDLVGAFKSNRFASCFSVQLIEREMSVYPCNILIGVHYPLHRLVELLAERALRIGILDDSYLRVRITAHMILCRYRRYVLKCLLYSFFIGCTCSVWNRWCLCASPVNSSCNKYRTKDY